MQTASMCSALEKVTTGGLAQIAGSCRSAQGNKASTAYQLPLDITAPTVVKCCNNPKSRKNLTEDRTFMSSTHHRVQERPACEGLLSLLFKQITLYNKVALVNALANVYCIY